jgi:hypothetical protein
LATRDSVDFRPRCDRAARCCASGGGVPHARFIRSRPRASRSDVEARSGSRTATAAEAALRSLSRLDAPERGSSSRKPQVDLPRGHGRDHVPQLHRRAGRTPALPCLLDRPVRSVLPDADAQCPSSGHVADAAARKVGGVPREAIRALHRVQLARRRAYGGEASSLGVGVRPCSSSPSTSARPPPF